MRMLKNISALVSLLIMVALIQTAAIAAEPKNTSEAKPKYKKLTGEVMSANPTSITVKGRSKSAVTFAITEKTDVIGAKAVAEGDRVAVNYRAGKSGNSATRIKVLSAKAVPAAKPAASPKPDAAISQ